MPGGNGGPLGGVWGGKAADLAVDDPPSWAPEMVADSRDGPPARKNAQGKRQVERDRVTLLCSQS